MIKKNSLLNKETFIEKLGGSELSTTEIIIQNNDVVRLNLDTKVKNRIAKW